MSRTIWKYEVPLTAAPSLFWLPADAEPLHVDMQSGTIQMWWLLDARAETVERRVAIVGTGHLVPGGDGSHVGTVKDGDYIWHLFVEDVAR